MLITERMLKLVFLAVLATASLAPAAVAVDPNADPNMATLQGSVSVTYDDNNEIESVQLVTDGITYEVVLNAIGKQLGEEMDGEKVEVQAMIFIEDEQNWIRVIKFKAVTEEE